MKCIVQSKNNKLAEACFMQNETTSNETKNSSIPSYQNLSFLIFGDLKVYEEFLVKNFAQNKTFFREFFLRKTSRKRKPFRENSSLYFSVNFRLPAKSSKIQMNKTLAIQ